jgi:hypothetical protein
VKVDFAFRKYHYYIAGVIARIFEREPDHRGLAVLLLQRFIRKRVSINYVGLRIVCDSLLVWHVSLLGLLLGWLKGIRYVVVFCRSSLLRQTQ